MTTTVYVTVMDIYIYKAEATNINISPISAAFQRKVNNTSLKF